MQYFFETLFEHRLDTFLNGFFWIDLCVICVFLLFMYLYILHQSKKITAKNVIYNANLLKFRTEVYHFYEKNFFL